MTQVSSRLQNASGTRRRILIFLSLLLLCFCGCKDTINSLGELGQLRNDLIKEFHESNITVSLNNSTNLAVTFTNSPLNAGLSYDRFRRAQETALFIKRRYAGIGRIETMLIKFMTQETREIDGFVFGKNASLIGAPPGDDPQNAFNDEQDVGVTYNATRNESEVRVRQIQLEGDMEKGLALSLHFKIRGDATTAGHASGIPASIVFTFSSFAPAKVFQTDPQLKLVADGAVIFSDKAHNLNSSSEGGRREFSCAWVGK
jgi:hypothetical protein